MPNLTIRKIKKNSTISKINISQLEKLLNILDVQMISKKWIKFENKIIEQRICRYFNISNFKISKYCSFYISLFQILIRIHFFHMVWSAKFFRTISRRPKNILVTFYTAFYRYSSRCKLTSVAASAKLNDGVLITVFPTNTLVQSKLLNKYWPA